MKQKTFNFERGGSVASGSQIDNSILVGAPDSTKHVLTHRVLWNSRFVGPIGYVIICSTVKDRRCKTQTQFFPGPSEYSLVNLSEVHT